MRLSKESLRVQLAVLVPAWLAIAFCVWAHAYLVRDYLEISGSLGLRGAPEATTPLRQIYPGFAADAQTWVRHALALLEGDSVRLRFTTIDNAPFGREVHWNSCWAWAIAGSGKLHHLLTGTPLTRSVEQMTLWLPGFTLVVIVVGLSSWVTRRSGLLAGLMVAFALGGQNRFYEGFFPAYVDHHGLITISNLLVALGACLMGAGWWREDTGQAVRLLPESVGSARGAAILSGVGGAFGLWVGAASVIPIIAFVGVAGVLTVLWFGRQAKARGERFDGSIWRWWGRSGAVASVCFYLLEYAPLHFGLRLEVNHPFYALAWWGAAELIATFSQWWLDGCPRRVLPWRSVALHATAVMVAPVTVVIGGTTVFTVIDPFLAKLHNKHIQEFLPLWHTLSRGGWKPILEVVLLENLPMLAALGALAVFRRRVPPLVWFGLIIVVLANVMAWWQSRWLLNTAGPMLSLTFILLCFLLGGSSLRVRWTVVAVLVTGLYGFFMVRRVTLTQSDVQAKRVAPADAMPALMRDIARTIRASQPEGEIVLVSSPNSSTAIGYYGRFKTLGTLYWENNEGLKAAGSILAAPSVAEAERLIRERKVTHIAMVSEENFILPYFQLLNPNRSDDDVKKTFGHQLLVDKVMPVWIRTLPYRVPDDFKALNVNVLLMQVAFDQTPADALYHIAMTKVEMGDLEMAERDFEELTKKVPGAPQPWFRLAELLIRRQAWSAAVDAYLAGISRSPSVDKSGAYASAAAVFYRSKQAGEAVRIYRAALAVQFDANLASYLGWVLATTANDGVRNGEEALDWAAKAVQQDPGSPTYLNTFAAALAETGRMKEAVDVARKALARAEALKDEASIRVTQARLQAYLEGKVWRE